MEIVIEQQRRAKYDWRELRSYRELLYYFAWRDLKVRYKQTAIGASWAILQPTITMVVFTVFFNRVAGIKSGQTPYPIFAYSGLLFWNYFSSGLSRASNSLISNQGVITKIYFPRLLAPVASTVVALVDFCIATSVFVALLIYYQITPGLLGVVFFIPAAIVTFLSATGLGLIFATLNVRYRDIQQALPFFIQLGLFLTPVIYPIGFVPHRYQWLLYLNPMAGVITAERAWTLHQGHIDGAMLLVSIAASVALALVGATYFAARERQIADII